ncbi:hypothetical protein SESBI_17892 [Sesbania bispinosa]|nr:hypothetical protein SESBI_17892 [Sesbania bispinosa]
MADNPLNAREEIVQSHTETATSSFAQRGQQQKPKKKKGLSKILGGVKLCFGIKNESRMKFEYDSTSHALNFDDGIDREDDANVRSFSQRFANPQRSQS